MFFIRLSGLFYHNNNLLELSACLDSRYVSKKLRFKIATQESNGNEREKMQSTTVMYWLRAITLPIKNEL